MHHTTFNIKRRAAIWDFFSVDSSDKSLATCGQCHKTIRRGKNTSDYSTTPLISHLRNHHLKEHQEYLMIIKTQTVIPPSKHLADVILPKMLQPSLVQAFERVKIWEENSASANKIHAAIAHLLCDQHLPMTFVESDRFKILLAFLEPRYHLPSRFMFSETIIPSIDRSVRLKISEILMDADYLSFTSDIWTASCNNDPYISLVAHFINPLTFQRHNFVLAIRHLPGSHTGQLIGDMLLGILVEWNIPTSKVHLIITDEGANIKSGISLAKLTRLPCAAHLLHRVVIKGVLCQPAVSNLLSICRNIVTRFSHSPLACEKLRVLQHQLNLPQHSILQEVQTRWNSTYFMLERLLEQKQAIHLYAQEVDLAVPNSSQWQQMTKLVHILRPFEEATRIFSANYSSSSCVLPSYILMRKKLVSLDDCEGMKTTKTVLISELDSRFGFADIDSTDATCLIACFLDPRYKVALFTSGTLSRAEKLLASELTPILTADTEASSNSTSASTSVIGKPPIPCEESIWDGLQHAITSLNIGNRPTNQTIPVAVTKEIKTYLSEAYLPNCEDPLLWWKQRSISYPLLSQAARRYLSAPSSSVSSERLFSVAGNVLTDNRNRLSPQQAERLIFLHENLRHLNYLY